MAVPLTQTPVRLTAPPRQRARHRRCACVTAQQTARRVAAGSTGSQPPLLAFTGGGIFFFWQVGAVLALKERVDLRSCQMTGVSAGALTATLAACDVDMEASVDLAYALTLEKDLYNRAGGLAGVWGPLIRRWLHELLPPDAADVCSGRVGLFTLALWPPLPRRLYTDQYSDKDDLIEAAMASVHIPYFLDGRMSRGFRGRRCIDGSVLAPRDVVDTRKRAAAGGAAQASGLLLSPPAAPTLLVDHNADAVVSSSRKFGDFVALTTREGLQSMVDGGRAYMAAELASGRLDALLAAAPTRSGAAGSAAVRTQA